MKKYLSLLIIFGLLYSCKKDSTTSTTTSDSELNQKMFSDNNLAENASTEANIIADDAYSFGKLVSRSGQGGSAILADTVKITKVDSVITIDFGVNGIVGRDGKVRKGKIIITFTNGYIKPGASHTNTFDNYYVNGNKVEGSRTVTYNGLNANQQPNWDIQANLTITKANNAGVVTWNSTRNRVMTAGSSTRLDWSDDEYTISGSSSGLAANGNSYTMTITTPLVYKVACYHLQNGVIHITRGSKVFDINYGYGSGTPCDNQALLTYNGVTTVITL